MHFEIIEDTGRYIDRRVARYLKPGAGKPSGYTLELDDNSTNLGAVPIHRDTRYSLLLKRKETVIACLGFEVDGNTVHVNQIQGRGTYLCDTDEKRRVNRGLNPIYWDRMLLDTMTNLAALNGFSRIMVDSMEDPEHAQEDDMDEHLLRLYNRYNKNAERAGFSYDSDSQKYIKYLYSKL
ncbi:MAG: hypothetical protein HY364_00035 [Candidatus Aenigmarchaeota archaeon]|nr:hypothetical protein [Candidatus Aenigmarchaeota archaeon]